MLLTFVVFVNAADYWRTGCGGAPIYIKRDGNVLHEGGYTPDSAAAGQIFAECATIADEKR